MHRAVVGYHRDDAGDWVAELSCGHGQHVRHRPPFQPRPWVLEAAGRAERLGTPLECPGCDRAELPDGLQLVRTTPEWDQHTMPAGLRRAHRVARGTWGRIRVRRGRLRFRARSDPPLDVWLYPGQVQAIPPEVEHEVEPQGAVAFAIDFLSVPAPTAVFVPVPVPESAPGPDPGAEPAVIGGIRVADGDGVTDRGGERERDVERGGAVDAGGQAEPSPASGGDPACWAHLVCAECGALDADGEHRAGCAGAEGAPG